MEFYKIILALEIKNAIEEGNEDILNEISELNKNEYALLEKAFAEFNPELEYRVHGIDFEQRVPNLVCVDIINT